MTIHHKNKVITTTKKQLAYAISQPQTMDIPESPTARSVSSDEFSLGGSTTSPSPRQFESVDRNLQARGTQRKYLRRGVRSPRMLQFNVKKLLMSMQRDEGAKFESPYRSRRKTSFYKKVRAKQTKS